MAFRRRVIAPAIASSLAITAAYIGQILALQTVAAGKVFYLIWRPN